MRNIWAYITFGLLTAYIQFECFTINLWAILFIIFIAILIYLNMRRPIFFIFFLVAFIFGSLYINFLHTNLDIDYNSRQTGTGLIYYVSPKALYLKDVSLDNNEHINRIILSVDDEKTYDIGEYISFRGVAKKYEPKLNPGNRDPRLKDLSNGIQMRIKTTKIDSLENFNKLIVYREVLKDRCRTILDESLLLQHSEVLKSALLGDQLDYDSATHEMFSKLGLIHLLSISGLHIGLYILFIREILKLFSISYNAKLILSHLWIVLFLFFVGWPVSAVRTWSMLLFIDVGKHLKQQVEPLHALFFVSTVLLIIRPYYFYNIGFLLSFLSILGIYGPGKRLHELFYGLGHYIQTSLSTTLGVSLTIYPILIRLNSGISALTILANLLLVPIFSVILLLGMLIISFGLINIHLVYFLGLALDGVMGLNFSILEALYLINFPLRLPVLNVFWSMIYYLGLYLWTIEFFRPFPLRAKTLLLIQLAFTLISIGAINFFTSPELLITMLYIGQGDCILIEYEDYVALVDTGGSFTEFYSPTAIYGIPYFTHKNIYQFDDIFISHFDCDHCAGILDLAENFNIQCLSCSYIPKDNQLFNQFIEQNLPIKYEPEVLRKIQDLIIYSIPNDYCGNDENALSTLLVLSYKEFNMLFTGDLPLEQELNLLNFFKPVDVLKVGHHGSNTSTSEELLEVTQPELALISSGRHNLYGHPHNEVIEKLNNAQIPYINTAEDGAIELAVKNNELYINTFSSQTSPLYLTGFEFITIIIYNLFGFYLYIILQKDVFNCETKIFGSLFISR